MDKDSRLPLEWSLMKGSSLVGSILVANIRLGWTFYSRGHGSLTRVSVEFDLMSDLASCFQSFEKLVCGLELQKKKNIFLCFSTFQRKTENE